MNKKLKIAGIALAVIVVLAVVAGIGIRMSLGAIVKKGIETIGPKATGAKVKVDSVSFALLKGQIEIEGFLLGNPEGFTTSESIRAKRVFVDIDPLSLIGPKIHVESVVIDGVALTCEQGLTSNNLTSLKTNVDAFVKSLPGQGGSKEQEKSFKVGEVGEVGGRRLQVDKVEISNITVSLAIKGVSKEGAGVPVPGIKLERLGEGTDGITPADLAGRILDKLLSGAIEAVTPSLKDIGGALSKGANATVDGAKEGAGKALDGAKGALDSVLGVFK